MTLKTNFAQYLRNNTIFQDLTRFYQNGQYRALFWQPCLKVGVQEGLSLQYLMLLSENTVFLRHDFCCVSGVKTWRTSI